MFIFKAPTEAGLNVTKRLLHWCRETKICPCLGYYSNQIAKKQSYATVPLNFHSGIYIENIKPMREAVL